MASRKTDRVGEALTRLPMLSTEGLRAEWQRIYGHAPPPRISRELLLRAIAYRLQERSFGGMRPALLRRLQQIAGSIREGGEPATGATPRLKPGTRLLRDWHGRGHEVLV